MDISSLGHQPEWGSEAKSVWPESSLSKHNIVLLGKNNGLSALSPSFFSLWTNEFFKTSNSRKDGFSL